MKLTFENYSEINKLFSKHIKGNFEQVLELASEFEYNQYIDNLEIQFAQYNGSKYSLAVNSGTSALQLALDVSSVKENDEVILPSYTYIATGLAVSNIKAKPVFVDIKNDTLTIDPNEIVKYITPKTKAIIAVHIHGNPCDMDKIVKIANDYNLKLIEDSSHAHGASYKNIKVGNFGIGCFSCQSSKNLSCIGNGGLISTNDKDIYDKLRNMILVSNDPEKILSNRAPCRMDVTQAAILKAKLPFLNKIIELKRGIAQQYIDVLPKSMDCQLEQAHSKHVYRDFVIITRNRDKLIQYLTGKGIETKIRYRLPLHLTSYYENIILEHKNLPITENIMAHLLWLPISFALSKKDITYLCNTLKACQNDFSKL